jgi:hypothetical protein
MVYSGLEGPREWQKATGFARERMANWRALARWQKPCRVRLSSRVILDIDVTASNSGYIPVAFSGLDASSKIAAR